MSEWKDNTGCVLVLFFVGDNGFLKELQSFSSLGWHTHTGQNYMKEIDHEYLPYISMY